MRPEPNPRSSTASRRTASSSSGDNNATSAPAIAQQSLADGIFFVLGGISAVWFATVLVRQSFTLGWWELLFLVGFWGVLAYLVLPRLHRILTRIYVPDYFMGRTRTSDGLFGDPVNLAVLGSESQIHTSMREARWIRADDLSVRTGLRIVRSTLVRRSYLEAPVSPLFLFGRKQDFAYQQEVDGSPGKRHHVRFWRTPEAWLLPGGVRTEWLAAGTYDRSVGFSLFTLQVTHKIAPDTDEERDHIVSTILESQSRASVRVIRDYSTGYHSRNGGGDSIITDGDLPILDLGAVEAMGGAHAQPTDSRDRRPAAIIVGVAITAISGLVSIATGITQLLEVAATAADIEASSGVNAAPVLTVAAIAVLLIGLATFLLAWRVFRGGRRARFVVMLLSALSIAALIIASETGSPEDVSQNLWSAAMTVLVLLALSSERALVYVNRSQKALKHISGLPGGTARF